MFGIKEISDKDLKTSITLKIMNSLPKWFNPPEDIVKKSVLHKKMPFFAAFDESRVIGYKFITVKTLDSSAEYEPYDRTRAFYRKNGFYPLEVFPLYWNEDNPCLFLAKYIG